MYKDKASKSTESRKGSLNSPKAHNRKKNTNGVDLKYLMEKLNFNFHGLGKITLQNLDGMLRLTGLSPVNVCAMSNVPM